MATESLGLVNAIQTALTMGPAQDFKAMKPSFYSGGTVLKESEWNNVSVRQNMLLYIEKPHEARLSISK